MTLLLLEDHSHHYEHLDIPQFLQRKPNGAFRFPRLYVSGKRVRLRAVTDAVTDRRPVELRSRYLTDHDVKVIESMLDHEALVGTAKAAVTRQKNAAERAEKQANKEAARLAANKNFVQHFKWGFNL